MKIRDRSTLDLFDSMKSNADRAPITVWIDPDEPNGDSFAGGGGAKLGIANAYEKRGLVRRAKDVAVNHWPEALAMYAANHPNCRIFCEDVLLVDPVKASGGRRYALAWFSPTCIFFSQARGGPLDAEEATKVRGLAHVMIDWAKSDARPRVSCLENVKQFEQWGPLHRQHAGKCSVEAAIANGTTDRKGKVTPKCLKGCCYGRPIKARKGEFFRQFVEELRTCYRYVSWRVLKAHHYGAPTSRERFFLIASDKPVAWPTPTHGPGLKPYHTAAECIDWDLPCPSIFDRDRELADKTLARIARGIRKYVLESAKPFIIPATHGDKEGKPDTRAHSVDEPLRTITTLGAQYHLISPYLVHRSNGERVGQAPRIYDIERPLGTIVAQGQKHALVAAFLAKHYGGHESTTGGKQLTVPFDTVTSIDHHSLVAAHLMKFQQNGDGIPLNAPLHTVMAGAARFSMVSAFLARYNGTGHAESLQLPLGTVTTRDRFALVTVTIDGEEYVVVDIRMRMLSPRELFRAQGFGDSYDITPQYNGKQLTKTAQIRMCGNSVAPPVAAAVIRAQFGLEAA